VLVQVELEAVRMMAGEMVVQVVQVMVEVVAAPEGLAVTGV
jgi:hypothetical protein